MHVIISTACKLNGSLETAHNVHVVKSIIWKRLVTGGHLDNPVCYDIATVRLLPRVLLTILSVLSTVLHHAVGPGEDTFKREIWYSCTDRRFRVTDVIYIHKPSLTPPGCCLKLTATFLTWGCAHIYTHLISVCLTLKGKWKCGVSTYIMSLLHLPQLNCCSACITHGYVT